MRYNFVFALATSALLLGCVGNQKVIEDLNRRQAVLETKIDKMSQDINAMRSDMQEQAKQIEQKMQKEYSERIGRSLKQTYSNLEKRIDNLEKRNTSGNYDSPESPDALYSIAESLYAKREYRQAILAFQRFIATYPRDRRVALSYLKQGLSLINIGKKVEAKFFLKTLIDKFPKSDEAEVARERLKEIGQNS